LGGEKEKSGVEKHKTECHNACANLKKVSLIVRSASEKKNFPFN